MKKVLSISLGSSVRDHKVKKNILGENFIIERRGTDGDKKQAQGLFNKFDGKYDAFGLGGIDLNIYAGGKKYVFRDAKKLIKNVKITPVVDGSGLKNTLERKVLNYLKEQKNLVFSQKKVLIVSAVDRFGMAETFQELGAKLIIGDLIFGLGIPLSLNSIKSLSVVTRIIAPIITKLPFEFIYPTGDKQNEENKSFRYSSYYKKADIIAGDFHFIKKYMPQNLTDKIILTNTVTESDIKILKNKGVKTLITTTPDLEGRSFGTNVIEAVLVAISEKSPADLSNKDYLKLLDKINFSPRVINLKNN